MSEWPNPNEIDAKEIVGRRLFEEPYYCTEIRRETLKPNHFIDTRHELDLSLDRIGDNGTINKRARRKLSVLAFRMAEKQSKTFYGWCTCRVDILARNSYTVKPTPDRSDDDKDYWNDFHAEISRAEHRKKRWAYELATTLAHIFTPETQDEAGNKPKILKPIESKPVER